LWGGNCKLKWQLIFIGVDEFWQWTNLYLFNGTYKIKVY